MFSLMAPIAKSAHRYHRLVLKARMFCYCSSFPQLNSHPRDSSLFTISMNTIMAQQYKINSATTQHTPDIRQLNDARRFIRWAAQSSVADTSTAPNTGVQTRSRAATTARPQIIDILRALGPDATEVDLDQAVIKHLEEGNEVLLEAIKPFYQEPMRLPEQTLAVQLSC